MELPSACALSSFSPVTFEDEAERPKLLMCVFLSSAHHKLCQQWFRAYAQLKGGEKYSQRSWTKRTW